MPTLPPEPLQIVEPFTGRNDTRRNLVGLSRVFRAMLLMPSKSVRPCQ